MGVLSASIHQVAMQMFWFLSFFPEPLSSAAQALIAKELTSPFRVRVMARLLAKLSAITSAVLTIVTIVVFKFFPYLFS